MERTNTATDVDESTLATIERRVRVRHNADLKALCQTEPASIDDFWLWGEALDISTDGICLVLSCRFPSGTQIAIEPVGKADVIGKSIHAKIVHSKKGSDGKWILGCEFAQPLSAAELQGLVN